MSGQISTEVSSGQNVSKLRYTSKAGRKIHSGTLTILCCSMFTTGTRGKPKVGVKKSRRGLEAVRPTPREDWC